MKIYFVRHGEAMDDIRNEYGGWADAELSPKGIEGGKRVAEFLKEKEVKVGNILTSPLKRAVETAKIIADILERSVETFVYLKERNTYGLLCGVDKDEAENKYPELVEAYKKGEEVFGYENYDFFLKRINKLFDKLKETKSDVICVTHGKVLGAIFKDLLKIEVKEFGDNCVAEIEIDDTGAVKFVNGEGIEFSREK